MVAVFTVIGYICCILLVGLIITTSFKFLKCCFQNDVVIPDIRDHKNNIDTSLYEAKKEGYKIMFRDPECKSYEMYNIHIATQGDEEIIVIDLNK